MDWKLATSSTVPLALQSLGPVLQQVDFVQENDGSISKRCPTLGLTPKSFPEAGDGCLRTVGGRVDRGIALTLEDLQEQRCFAYLPRPR